MNTIDEKTFKQGVDEFIGCAPEGGWSDYWAMQQDWEFYKDSLCRDGVITQKQADSWSNPCTPDTFARWQRRNGLTRRGYESKKSEDTYDRPVTLYASTRYDDAEEAQKFLDSISGGEVKVSKERNGDTLSVSIEGADEDIDAFLAVYKDNYDTLEKDCDADVNGWTDPVDLKYYTVQGRKELTGESHKKSEGLPFGKRFTDAAGHTIELSDWRIKEDDLGYFCGYDKGGKPIFDQDISKAVVFPFDQENYPNDEVSKEMDRLWKMGYTNTRKLQKATRVESKKSEALTKDTIVVGQIFNSNLKWIERTLKQVKKKFPNVESDAFGNTLTIRGKLSDVSDVCDTYKTGSYMLCQDNGDAFLPNAAGDDLDDAEISKALSESKKSEGIGDRIKMGIDYNMFMRMCGSAAYLDDNEDYWDALWEYYSEMGEIEDACEFFDNLFQYTAWCDADTVYDEYLDDKFKDESKSKEECIQAAIDDGDLDAYKHDSGNYLVIS